MGNDIVKDSSANDNTNNRLCIANANIRDNNNYLVNNKDDNYNNFNLNKMKELINKSESDSEWLTKRAQLRERRSYNMISINKKTSHNTVIRNYNDLNQTNSNNEHLKNDSQHNHNNQHVNNNNNNKGHPTNNDNIDVNLDVNTQNNNNNSNNNNNNSSENDIDNNTITNNNDYSSNILHIANEEENESTSEKSINLIEDDIIDIHKEIVESQSDNSEYEQYNALMETFESKYGGENDELKHNYSDSSYQHLITDNNIKVTEQLSTTRINERETIKGLPIIQRTLPDITNIPLPFKISSDLNNQIDIYSMYREVLAADIHMLTGEASLTYEGSWHRGVIIDYKFKSGSQIGDGYWIYVEYEYDPMGKKRRERERLKAERKFSPNVSSKYQYLAKQSHDIQFEWIHLRTEAHRIAPVGTYTGNIGLNKNKNIQKKVQNYLEELEQYDYDEETIVQEKLKYNQNINQSHKTATKAFSELFGDSNKKRGMSDDVHENSDFKIVKTVESTSKKRELAKLKEKDLIKRRNQSKLDEEKRTQLINQAHIHEAIEHQNLIRHIEKLDKIEHNKLGLEPKDYLAPNETVAIKRKQRMKEERKKKRRAKRAKQREKEELRGEKESVKAPELSEYDKTNINISKTQDQEKGVLIMNSKLKPVLKRADANNNNSNAIQSTKKKKKKNKKKKTKEINSFMVQEVEPQHVETVNDKDSQTRYKLLNKLKKRVHSWFHKNKANMHKVTTKTNQRIPKSTNMFDSTDSEWLETPESYEHSLINDDNTFTDRLEVFTGLINKPVVRDDHSMFRSIAHQIYGNEMKYNQILEEISNYNEKLPLTNYSKSELNLLLISAIYNMEVEVYDYDSLKGGKYSGPMKLGQQFIAIGNDLKKIRIAAHAKRQRHLKRPTKCQWSSIIDSAHPPPLHE